jgi:DeoD family purine-nucleoside phosphorylase
MHALQDIDLPGGDAETLHLNPAAEFRPNVLLPGDPARAMAIATKQLVEPRMFNHRRGLWGYSGVTPRGTGILTQATGMGGPSAAIVCEELADLGAELFLRVGTCGAIDSSVKLGDFVIVSEAISDDGASAALGAGARIAADQELIERLTDAAKEAGVKSHVGASATVDLFYDPDGDARHDRLRKAGALAIEMEAAAVLAVGARREVRSACLLAVTDELWGDGRERLGHDAIQELGATLGAIGIGAVEALRSS